MSFNIKLQHNASETYKLDKKITDIVTLSGVLREESSVMNPSIMIEADIADLGDVNYCHINQFGRDYYINDITSVRNGIVRIDCHVDVLMSFRDQLRQCTGIIRRNENAWNLYLNDGSLKVYQNPKIITKNFPAGFDSMSFLLAVAGG